MKNFKELKVYGKVFKLPSNLGIHGKCFRITKFINKRNVYINTGIKAEVNNATEFKINLNKAIEFLNTFEADCSSGKNLNSYFKTGKIPVALLERPDILICDLLEEKYAEYVLEKDPRDHSKQFYKNSTLDKLRYSINFWKASLTNKRVEEVSYKLIADILITHINDIESRKKRGASKKSVWDKTKPLRDILGHAAKMSIIAEDPFSKKNAFSEIYRRCRSIERKELFTVQEVKYILSNTHGEYKNLLTILFFTGIRSSEAIALTYDDIDFANGVLKINKCIYRGKVDNPKTESGNRKLQLLPVALEAFKSQLEYKRKDNYIFHTEKGDRIRSTTNLSRKFKRLLKKIGLPEATPHVARHFFTSLMLEYKESEIATYTYLGHRDRTMISRVYAHKLQRKENEAVMLNINISNIQEVIDTKKYEVK